MGGQSKVIKKSPPHPLPFKNMSGLVFHQGSYWWLYRVGLSSGVLLVVVHKCISFAQVNGCVTGKIHVFG